MSLSDGGEFESLEGLFRFGGKGGNKGKGGNNVEGLGIGSKID